MPKERLKSLLADLNRELDQTPTLDPELAARLRQAAEDVDKRLATSDAGQEDTPPPREEEGLIAPRPFDPEGLRTSVRGPSLFAAFFVAVGVAGWDRDPLGTVLAP